MTEALTQDAPASAEVADEAYLTKAEFAQRFNRGVSGKAVYDATSDGSNLEPPIKVVVGEAVPVSRKHIAAYCGLSYNALIAREKSARAGGINLTALAKGKRGKSNDVDAINKLLAVDATANEIANG
jgi:hypothetical protein